MTEQSEIKILRLNTGEDIIANCIMDDENGSVLVGNPMKVIVRRMSELGRTMLVMMPWLPLELVEEDLASINYGDIITMVQPKKSFIDYYFDTVDQYHVALKNREHDGDVEFGDNELDEEIDEDTMQEMLELLKESKKNSIH